MIFCDLCRNYFFHKIQSIIQHLKTRCLAEESVRIWNKGIPRQYWKQRHVNVIYISTNNVFPMNPWETRMTLFQNFSQSNWKRSILSFFFSLSPMSLHSSGQNKLLFMQVIFHIKIIKQLCV